MSIDQKVMDAYLDWSGEQARRGIIECDWPGENETVEDWLRRKLTEAGIEVTA